MAYAALASLLHTTAQILNPDPYPVHFITKQIESLNESAGFLLDFLEAGLQYNINQEIVQDLEIKMRNAAFKAEDALECQTANHFSQDSTSQIDSIKEDVKKIQDGGGLVRQPRTSHYAGSSEPVTRGNNNNATVEINTDSMMTPGIMERLYGERTRLEVIPIVGMGGIGKTTLARTLFNCQVVIDRFHIRAWVTISQEYRFQDVVQILLDQIKMNFNIKKDVGTTVPSKELQEKKDGLTELYQTLFGRRYLIVLDDVWNPKVWDDLRKRLPDNNNTSRIMLTTRHKEVATYVNSFNPCHEMELLDKDMSWQLFCQSLFGKEDCPSELVKTGKRIVQNCGGLPLAIVVIAGLLSKQNMTEEYWEHVVYSINPLLTEKDSECSKILSLSYNYLPHRLKPCFLYMGFFPEDYEIHVSKLIKLWIAEGFLRPVKSKSLESVAEEYLEDLISRNLIMVRSKGSSGKPKTCIIHDLLRDICLREAQKDKFLYVLNKYIPFNPEKANNQRRVSIHPGVIYDHSTCSDDDGTKKNDIEVLYEVMRSKMRLARSFISPASFPCESELRFGSNLLKVLEFEKEWAEFPKEILQLVNLRYLALDHLNGIPSSISRLWNLETLIASDLAGEDLPSEIWDMTQLRHVEIGNCCLRVKVKKPDCVLKNLQTLSGVMNFKCKKKTIARIPNLRKLKTTYDYSRTSDWSSYRLRNLHKLDKLESLSCSFYEVPNNSLLQNLSIPISLKKLTLRGCQFPWEDMTIIGVLPNLEILKLQSEAFRGPVWETKVREFPRLKFLSIEKPVELQEWKFEYFGHFPYLEHLILRECNFKSSSIGEIACLGIIELYKCSPATIDSCKEAQDNSDIKVIVHSSNDQDDNNS